MSSGFFFGKQPSFSLNYSWSVWSDALRISVAAFALRCAHKLTMESHHSEYSPIIQVVMVQGQLHKVICSFLRKTEQEHECLVKKNKQKKRQMNVLLKVNPKMVLSEKGKRWNGPSGSGGTLPQVEAL